MTVEDHILFIYSLDIIVCKNTNRIVVCSAGRQECRLSGLSTSCSHKTWVKVTKSPEILSESTF